MELLFKRIFLLFSIIICAYSHGESRSNRRSASWCDDKPSVTTTTTTTSKPGAGLTTRRVVNGACIIARTTSAGDDYYDDYNRGKQGAARDSGYGGRDGPTEYDPYYGNRGRTSVGGTNNNDYRYDYEDGSDDRSRQRSKNAPIKPRYVPRQSSLPGFEAVSGLMKNQRQLGATLVGLGMLLSFMGMMLFFEGNLLRLGNICIIAGVPLLVGPGRVKSFFFKESRMQATIITSIGILLVFWGKPRLGIICEIFGLLNLFGNMLPLLATLGKQVPIVGDVISAFEPKKKRNAFNDY